MKKYIYTAFITVCAIAQTFAQTTYPTVGFTLPAGKTIVITYEVDVNAEACDPEVTPPTNLSNQASVSGSNFTTVLTDEAAGAPITPTLTPFATVSIGNLVFNDVNRDGDYDAGIDAGINGVLVKLFHDVGTVANELDADDVYISETTTATVSGQAGTYSFAVCPDADYIVLVDEENFMGAAALANGGNPFVSSPITPAAGDPDTDTDDNDDNGDPVAGFGVAAKALSIGFADNNTVDFGFKTPTTVSIADNAASESTGVLNFTVTRNDNSDAFSLTVNTNNGTAGSSDFTAISGGTVSFTAGGSLTATIAVTLNEEDIVEDHETFTVTLSDAPTGIVLTDNEATGMIDNDDSANLTVEGGDSENESQTSRTFYATLSAPVQGGFKVAYTTNDGSATSTDDYSDNDGNLTFLGNTGEVRSFTVSLTNDNKVELNETFSVNIGGASIDITMTSAEQAGSIIFITSTQSETIANDDEATVSFDANVSEPEAITPQVFTVNLSNPVDVPVTMSVNTSDGIAETADMDYTAVSGGTVIFAVGETTGQIVNVAVDNDNKVEADETFNLTLSALSAGGRNVTFAGNGATLGATGTIENDDSATLTLSGGGAEEPEGQTGTSDRIFTIKLNNPVQGGFTVAYTSDDDDATVADNDYVDKDGMLTFAGTANEMYMVTVLVNGDRKVEFDESFDFRLGAISNTSLGSSISIVGSPKRGGLLNDEVDWGDAPTAAQSGFASSYPTTNAQFGASHVAVPFMRMGSSVDGEDDGQPTATANGDGSDENGVTLPAQFTAGTDATVVVNAASDGWLNAWMDFNRDGDWEEGDEYIISEYEVTEGNNIIDFPVPPGASPGISFARFRFSSESVLSYDGQAPDGEVEDYEVTITDNALSIGNAMVIEGNSGMVTASFTVSLSAPAPAGGVSFDIATTDDLAAAAEGDFVQKTLTSQMIAEGNQTFIFEVVVNGDAIVEDDETFFVDVTNVVGVGVANAQGIGTIGNDDTATLTFTGGNSENETATSRTFTATLSAAVQGGFQIAYTTNDGTTNPAMAGTDYTDNDGTLTFAGTSGEEETVTVTVANENLVELDETLDVVLGSFSMTSAEQAASITIVDGTQSETIGNDDQATVNLDPTTLSQAEAAGNQTRFVTLSNPVDVDVTLNFATSDASATDANNDYEPVNQTVTFLANSTATQNVTVVVNDDFTVETDEIFNITLSSLNASGRNVAIGAATGSGTIANDDSSVLTLTGGGSGNELNSGMSGKTFTATLTNPVQGGFSIAFATGGGSATAGSDYVDNDGTLTFDGTAMEMETWTVDVNGDLTVELDETFQASLGAISGTTAEQAADISVQMSPQTWQITNNDAATVSIAADVSQAENMTPQAFSVTLSNPVDVDVTVDFSTTDGTATDADNDFEPVSNQTVTFSANSTTAQTVNVTINNDSKVETDETYGVSIGNLQAMSRDVSPGTSSRTGTIENEDMATLTLSGGGLQSEGTSHVFTATLSHAVQDGFTVAYTTSDGTATTADGDYTDNDNTLIFMGNANEQQMVTVQTGTDSKVELDETFTITLGTPSAASINVSGSPQTGTIANNDQAIVSITNVSQAENITPQVFTVSISNPVDLAVSATTNTSNGTATTGDTDYSAVTNQSVSFGINSTTSQTVNVTINNDNKVEDNETYSLILSALSASGRNVVFNGSGLTLTGSGTIQNDDTATLTLSGGASQDEGNSGNTPYIMTVALTNPVQGGFTIAYNTNDGTATAANSDYADNDGTLTFLGNLNESQNFTVNAIGDFFVENNEAFTVSLASSPGSTSAVQAAAISIVGTPQTNTILNDEVDYGDAPDTYATLLASNGARHIGVFGMSLGATIDGENDGQPNPTGTGDDTDTEGDDDDGVTLPAQLIATTTTTLTVSASAAGKLDAWIDFNADGDFDLPGEQVFTNENLAAGNNALSFAMPVSVTQGTSFARFRFSSAGGLAPTGAASDGEVEDYQVQLINTQFSTNDPTVSEGNMGTANLAFVISRSNNASACSVDYTITGGTATTADSDYQALAAGTASFTAGGALTQTINVVVNGDVKVELDETVVMTLSMPVNGNILDGSGTGTITNDDIASVDFTNISPSQYEGNSGTTNMAFEARLSNPVDANVAVNFTTANGTATTANNDYQAISGSVTFSPGELTKTINVAIVGDCNIEADENFSLVLSNLQNNGRNVIFPGSAASWTGTGLVVNDDELPGIICPATFDQNTDPNVCNANVTVPLPTLSSVCGSQALEFRHRPVDGSNSPTGAWSAWIPSANNTQNFAKGRWEIEWQVTDGSGASICTFYFNVQDMEAPVAVCKTITVQLSASGLVSITPAQVDNGSSDNCSFTLSLDKMDFTCANVGSNIVTLTATDEGNFASSCGTEVIVQDLLPPTVFCKTATVLLDANGNGTLNAAQVNDGSTDNCGIQVLSVSPSTFNCSDLGANTVILTATDVNGNPSTCTTTVTVSDEIPPMVTCKNIPSLFLNPSGMVSITPAMVYQSGSDNCGTVNLASVSPNLLDCGDVGNSLVTLTVNDGNGNSATCTATVTIEPFINVHSIEVTNQTCSGSNGSIVINATSLGGQLGFSINGGQTFQLDGTFNGLNAGTYNIVVQAFGTVGCTVFAGSVTVTNSNVIQVWYKDSDNDGYSNGLTLSQCAQPVGYKLATNLTATSGDCNDNDPLQYPGQIWYKDTDNDGYSNGMTLIQCSKPTGYKHASQLTAISGDCNDSNASIKPGATEVCNNLDDDCDGLVDEGLSNMTYVGNVTFSNQAQVNAWSPCFDVIQGHLLIQNATIESLASLANLRKVTGNVTIKNTGLDSLSWLLNLDTIGGQLVVQTNAQLQTLHGLDSLADVGSSLKLLVNANLTDCCALHDLLNTPGGVGGAVSIYLNDTGCETLPALNAACVPFNPIVMPDLPAEECPDCGILQADQPVGLVVYPNPTHGELNIRLQGKLQMGRLHLYDAAGKQVWEQETDGEMRDYQFDAGSPGFQKGLYFLVYRQQDGSLATQRLVVQ